MPFSDISEGFGRLRTRFAHDRKYFDDDRAAKLVVLCVRADRALRSLRKYLWTVRPGDVPYHAATEAPRPRQRRHQRRTPGK
jgi:hypothetical protein